MSAASPIGEVLGTYRLEQEIGAGATSRVYLGVHERLGRKAAVKILSPAVVDDARAVSRLLTEARVVNDIRHPNIIDISDFIETEAPRRVALVMEYVEGPSLKALRDDPLPFPSAMAVALQLVAAIDAAHRAGVVHRDIKPDNLLLTADPKKARGLPRLKVVDFGIAKDAGDMIGQKPATGVMIGTPAYMAPEQIAGTPPPSAATDVYAIGEVLYELLTGKRAFPPTAAAEIVQFKLRGGLPTLETIQVPGGDALLAVVRRCLSRRPYERPSLTEVRDVLVAHTPEAVKRRLGPEVVEEGEMIETLPTDEDETRPPSSPRLEFESTDATKPTALPDAAAALATPLPFADALKAPAAAQTAASPLGEDPRHVAPAETAASPIGADPRQVAPAETAAAPLGDDPRAPIAFADTVASPLRDGLMAESAETEPPLDTQLQTMPAVSRDDLVPPVAYDPPEAMPDTETTAPGEPPPEETVTKPGAEPLGWGEAAKTTPLLRDPASMSADAMPMGTMGMTGPQSSLRPGPGRTWQTAAVAAALSAALLGIAAFVLTREPAAPAVAEPTAEKSPQAKPSAVVLPSVVRLNSTPAGAVVRRATGEPVGRTPVDVPIADGASVRVELTLVGYHSRSVTLEGAGKDVNVELTKRVAKPKPKTKAKTPTKKSSGPLKKDDFPSW